MITQTLAKQTPDGDIFWFDFTNLSGMRLRLTNYGATITSIIVPDQHGNMADVALGLDSIDDYLAGHPSLGSTIGRYANRIGKGRFTLNGKDYQLACNNGENHLHGGPTGYGKRIWNAQVQNESLVLQYHSADGEEHYPGNLDVTFTVTLTEDNAIDLQYHAVCDQDTIINMTNHSYFNLSADALEVNDHVLWVDAARFTPVDSGLIPTGEIADITGTALDFRTQQRVGNRQSDALLAYGGGYDNNLVFDSATYQLRATLRDPASGRRLDFYTDQPAVQLYTGQNSHGERIRKNGRSYGKYCGLCLEAQNFPDAPNHTNFPSPVLRAGDAYTQHTRYVFSLD